MGWMRPASANSTASLSTKEFKSLSWHSMNAFCFSSSSLRGITSGLWSSRPRRCGNAISPARLSYTFHIQGRIPACSRRRSGVSNAAAPRLPTPSYCLLAWRSDSWRSPHVEAGDVFDPAVLAADRVVIEQKRMGDFLTAPPLAQKHQGIRTPRHPATRRRIARQRRKRLAIFFAEDARLNPARNRIRPIGKRKKFLPDLQ